LRAENAQHRPGHQPRSQPQSAEAAAQPWQPAPLRPCV